MQLQEKGNTCAVGCECTNCTNRDEDNEGDEVLIQESINEEISGDDGDDGDDGDEDLIREVEETMQMVFGGEADF